MATVQAKLGVLILLVAAAPVIAAAATQDDDVSCQYIVDSRKASAAAADGTTWYVFAVSGEDGEWLWVTWTRVRPGGRGRFRTIVNTTNSCEDPCHLRISVYGTGLLPDAVRILAIIGNDVDGDEDEDDAIFVRVFNPELPTNSSVPNFADMDMCAVDNTNDDECSYVVSVQAPPAAVNTVVQFTVSNKAGQLLWWDFVHVKKVSFEFTSETDSKCQDPCHLKIKVKHHSAGLLPLSVSIRAIETDIQGQDFARTFTPVVPKIDPTKKPALVLDQADMDLCNIIQTK